MGIPARLALGQAFEPPPPGEEACDLCGYHCWAEFFAPCRAGRVGTIIIPALDRLSRDVRIAENLFYEFERLGVRVLIADMPTYNGKDRKDVLIRQIREAIAEENRKDIIERLWKGRQERIRKGQFPGGNVPYGFRRNGRGVLVDPDEAAAVTNIFALAERGKVPAQIAEQLNLEGRSRRNRRPWTRRQVSAVLTRGDLYRDGVIRYGEVQAQNSRFVLVDRDAPNPRREPDRR